MNVKMYKSFDSGFMVYSRKAFCKKAFSIRLGMTRFTEDAVYRRAYHYSFANSIANNYFDKYNITIEYKDISSS